MNKYFSTISLGISATIIFAGKQHSDINCEMWHIEPSHLSNDGFDVPTDTQVVEASLWQEREIHYAKGASVDVDIVSATFVVIRNGVIVPED